LFFFSSDLSKFNLNLVGLVGVDSASIFSGDRLGFMTRKPGYVLNRFLSFFSSLSDYRTSLYLENNTYRKPSRLRDLQEDYFEAST